MNILTKTGYKNIEDCVIGEEIVAYEVGTGIEITNTIVKIEKIYPDFFTTGEVDENENPIYEPFTWYLINGTYKIFKYKSIWTTPTTVKHGLQLEIGDTIYSDTDEDIIITSIEETEPDEFWYRFEISGDHSFIADGITLHNASRYWRGTTNTDWGNTGNWSSTSGGATGSSVPTSVDDAFFDSGGVNNCNTGTTNRIVLSINFNSGYTATFNFGGTLSIGSSAVFNSNTTYTSSGTPVLDTAGGGTKTITSNGATLPVSLNAATAVYTVNLADDLAITRNLIVGNNNNVQTFNGNNLYVGGGCTIFRIQGSTNIIFNGSGTLIASTFFNNNLTINTSGTYSFSGTFIKQTGSLNYISGTVITTGNTLRINGSVTLDTNGINWNIVDFNFGVGSFNITINSLLTASTIALNSFSSGLLSFIGTSGWTTNILIFGAPSISRTWRLTSGVIYTIKNSFLDTVSTANIRYTITSTVASSPAFLILEKAATQDLGFTNFTDIDASGGRTIWVWKPTLTSTNNIRSLVAPINVSKTFIK